MKFSLIYLPIGYRVGRRTRKGNTNTVNNKQTSTVCGPQTICLNEAKVTN